MNKGDWLTLHRLFLQSNSVNNGVQYVNSPVSGTAVQLSAGRLLLSVEGGGGNKKTEPTTKP